MIYVVYFISKCSETEKNPCVRALDQWSFSRANISDWFIQLFKLKLSTICFTFVKSINFSSKFLKLPPNKRPLMLCATMGLNEKILPASLPSLNDRMTLLWQLCAEQWSNRPILSKSHLSDKMRSHCFFILYLYTLNLLLYDHYSVINTLHQELLESTKTSDNYNHDCTWV